MTGRQHSQRRATRRKLQFAEFILLLIGFALVGWFSFSYLDTKIYQSYESYRLDAIVRGENPSIGRYLHGLLADSNRSDIDHATTIEEQDAVREQRARRAAIETGGLIGRIEVPRLKVSAVVREGSDDITLKRAAGHVPYTALPGEPGNVGIAAHRDSFFRNLRGVRDGDVIFLKTTWGTYEYVVDSLKIVLPENVEVLDPTPNPSITLVTCYPFKYVGSAPKRYIVRARQVNPPPNAGKPMSTRDRYRPSKPNGIAL